MQFKTIELPQKKKNILRLFYNFHKFSIKCKSANNQLLNYHKRQTTNILCIYLLSEGFYNFKNRFVFTIIWNKIKNEWNKIKNFVFFYIFEWYKNVYKEKNGFNRLTL